MNHTVLILEAETGLGERRKASRFPVTWPINLSGVDSMGMTYEECGELGNLSSSGALVRLPVSCKLKVGARAHIVIRIPMRTETWMRFQAIVTRLESGPTRYGLGLKFTTCRPEFSSQ
jgi:hypothetical protein